MVEFPNFKVNLTLDVKHEGGPNIQFFLLDIGSCWKNNGDPCDGDILTDVTRYSEMLINPATTIYFGDSTTGVLDVNALASQLYFYQVIMLFLLT